MDQQHKIVSDQRPRISPFFGGVLVLHLAAVVWHRFIKHDGVLARMWPSRMAA